MGLKKYYRFLYRKVVGALNPLKYARKIGVNMYEGGGTFIRAYFLGNGTLNYYAWKQRPYYRRCKIHNVRRRDIVVPR